MSSAGCVPAYNEEASIDDLIDRMAEVSIEQGWDYEIIVVDDGSADATGDLARGKGAEYPGDGRCATSPTPGLGRTIRRGLRAAAEASGPDDVIVTLDADLTQDPGYAPSMLARLDEGDADVVIASRYRQGAAVEGLSAFRTMLLASAHRALVAARAPDRRACATTRAASALYRASTVAGRRSRVTGTTSSPSGASPAWSRSPRGCAATRTSPRCRSCLRYDAKRKESAIKIVPTIGAYFRVIAKVAATRRKPVPWITLVAAFASIMLGVFAQRALQGGVAGLGLDASAIPTAAGGAWRSPRCSSAWGCTRCRRCCGSGCCRGWSSRSPTRWAAIGYAVGVVLGGCRRPAADAVGLARRDAHRARRAAS